VTGGAPLVPPPEDLEQTLARIHAIDHVEIIRIGTRALAYAPRVITAELVAVLPRNRVLAYLGIYDIFAPGVRHFIVNHQELKGLFARLENTTSGHCLPHMITLNRIGDFDSTHLIAMWTSVFRFRKKQLVT
jgi:L-lysine 2,3-aminomutase